MPGIPLALQTTYADLLDRCVSGAFDDTLAGEGAFTPKIVRGRRYWYFQMPSGKNRQQRYIGPETPELLVRIYRHKQARRDQRDRQALVSTLVRSARLPRPLPEVGAVLMTLAEAEVFRLRSVLIGTVAYQTYSAMLGMRLPASEADVTKSFEVAIAVGAKLPPMLEILREGDRSFRRITRPQSSRRITRYATSGGLRVDFLAPNPRPDDQRLHFLDFLLREPERAVVLHGAGIYVTVPAPERYAIHKLIVAQCRRQSDAVRDRDIRQAEALLAVLVEKRSYELGAAWAEAYARGKTWRKLLEKGLAMLNADVRDRTQAVGAHRALDAPKLRRAPARAFR